MTLLKNCAAHPLPSNAINLKFEKRTLFRSGRTNHSLSLAFFAADQLEFTRIDTKFIKDHLIEDYIDAAPLSPLSRRG